LLQLLQGLSGGIDGKPLHIQKKFKPPRSLVWIYTSDLEVYNAGKPTPIEEQIDYLVQMFDKVKDGLNVVMAICAYNFVQFVTVSEEIL
jgi:hypothetical protein